MPLMSITFSVGRPSAVPVISRKRATREPLVPRVNCSWFYSQGKLFVVLFSEIAGGGGGGERWAGWDF